MTVVSESIIWNHEPELSRAPRLTGTRSGITDSCYALSPELVTFLACRLPRDIPIRASLLTTQPSSHLYL
ncbi:hypothetical protein RRG08_003997 [Elysia crispata]|uniref:Uncharacterized protein n=1 Tax=Elysia crispata TaxID=231223 RepID=A0AAE1CTH8_9GAST|nr:hypothetical protein RRG08_003997 [Elysia crispata]